MDRKYSYDYIQVGLLVRYCSHFISSTTKESILDGLETLKTCLSDINFAVSVNLVYHLINEINQKWADVEENNSLPAGFYPKFKTDIAAIESTMFAEAGTKYVHIIPERRFNAEYLLAQPHKLLKEGAFGKLSDMAKYDFSSACRCISYGEATASAFHILRATEDTLKQFYFKYKKTNRLSKPMWGPMTNELRAKKTNKPNETILSALDLIRVSYRNPTQHPEATYDIESAQDLFGVCIDLLNKMTLEL